MSHSTQHYHYTFDVQWRQVRPQGPSDGYRHPRLRRRFLIPLLAVTQVELIAKIGLARMLCDCSDLSQHGCTSQTILSAFDWAAEGSKGHMSMCTAPPLQLALCAEALIYKGGALAGNLQSAGAALALQSQRNLVSNLLQAPMHTHFC